MADVSRLPWAINDHWDWQLQAACRGMDSEVFFHPDGERDPRRSQRVAAASQICARCAVREPCRDWARRVEEPYGVWGGEGEQARREHLARTRHDRSA